MHAATETSTHPFEAAGLGLAPFRCVAVVSKVGPIKLADGSEIGSAGQPMGSCDYCGTGIRDCYVIRSADGKQFEVGCDCVAKVARTDNRVTPLAEEVAEFKRKLLRERSAVRAERERSTFRVRKQAALDTLAGRPTLFVDQPHPRPDMAARGMTLRDSYVWLLANAGMKGCTPVIRAIAKEVALPVDPTQEAARVALVDAMEAAQAAERAERQRVRDEQEAARVAEQAARNAEKASRVYAGTIGERLRAVPVRVTYVRAFDGQFGTRWLVRMASVDGRHTFVLWTGSLPEATPSKEGRERGDVLLLTATVKAHEEYEGEAQTVVQRAVLVDQSPARVLADATSTR